MANSLYTRMGQTAVNLLSDYGQAVTISRVTGGSVNPVTGVVTAGTTSTQVVQGVIMPYSANLIDGTRILTDDRKLVLPATVEPLMTDKFIVGGVTWSPVAITANNPAGTAVSYVVQVRK